MTGRFARDFPGWLEAARPATRTTVKYGSMMKVAKNLGTPVGEMREDHGAEGGDDIADDVRADLSSAILRSTNASQEYFWS